MIIIICLQQIVIFFSVFENYFQGQNFQQALPISFSTTSSECVYTLTYTLKVMYNVIMS